MKSGKIIEEIVNAIKENNGGMSIKELRKKIKHGYTTIYFALLVLEKRGLVKKTWEKGRFVWSLN
ncbi:MAG: hypothetical protein QXJ14_02070 [Candidatus Aenigmatarchaeota archaeon]